MGEYTLFTIVAVLGVLAIEFFWLRTGILRTAQYWLSLAIAAFYLFDQKLGLRQFSYRVLSYFSGRNSVFLPFKSTQFSFKAS